MNTLKEKAKKAKEELKQFFGTTRGIYSWLLANVIVSAFWYIPMGIGFIFSILWLYELGVAIFVAMWLPPPIESIAVAFLTTLFYTKMFKKKV